VVSLTTELEDPEKVTVALLVAVAAAEEGRAAMMFLTKEAVLATNGTATGTACEGCPALPAPMERYVAAGGRFLVCPMCFGARGLHESRIVVGADLRGTVPLWQWIGDDDDAISFSP
jgi:predicted peroxiredoxin